MVNQEQEEGKRIVVEKASVPGKKSGERTFRRGAVSGTDRESGR